MTNRISSTLTAAAAVVLFAASAAAAEPAPAAPNPVLRWNELATRISAEQQTDPISESRMFAILQIAVHNAVNTIEPEYLQFGAPMPLAAGASMDAAVAEASRDVMCALLPARAADFEAALKKELAEIPEGPAKTRGIETGREAALKILA